MLEINVYSIIDSKVFGVKFGVNFLLAISSCKIEVSRLQAQCKGKNNATRQY
jgi:hypothetical protein